MRIALVSDAWSPQVNGVVRTLTTTVAELRRQEHAVETITPDGFTTVPCPSYPEIRLAIAAGRGVRRRLEAFAPDAVHIATEGPLGWAARRWCTGAGLPFTTSFHTRFPDYLAVRTGLPADLFWASLRRFHGRAARVFVATPMLAAELRARGLPHTHLWGRGVDLALFRPEGERLPELAGVAGPILLHVGRIAPEKNIEAFLTTNVSGTKVIVGDGPALATLRRRYPDALFLGALHGERLAAAYRSADAFVFPSRTDTFGLVMAEAIASGTAVAAYPVAGPLDVVEADSGVLDADLAVAIAGALRLDRARVAEAGRQFDWARCTGQFLDGLTPFSALAQAA
ncbi:glycosyltransferase family 1 protein [Sphingomonas sp. KR1UV-12]|uniref:Glycosyltransferase family 1 protein n=1 Tax=Sphingomonas aurea TaxID=3063994 RepID=A0ABT9ENM0_9SPHN|nr:glycosyltransferase family 1 protein [Sphingomonas sp. KR1UV-12]MDP1028432.1 glycosyltransferase family 1 protein [Sphingomonas sp. KR1UV-12]